MGMGGKGGGGSGFMRNSVVFEVLCAGRSGRMECKVDVEI